MATAKRRGAAAKPKATAPPKKSAPAAQAPKPPIPAIPVRYATLVSLLGKGADDPAVTAVLKRVGTVKAFSATFLSAREAGFDLTLERIAGNRVVLFPEGRENHRGYADLPAGFAWTTPMHYSPRSRLRTLRRNP